MTTLHERLADLAEQAPSGGPPADLWATGMRSHRRRRVGTAVIVAAAVVTLALLTGIGLTRGPEDVQPAAPRDGLGIPDRFYSWDALPTTRATGPVGPLVAVVPGWDRSLGVLTNGEHVGLELPDAASSDDVVVRNLPAVSADGTMLAYWLGGEEGINGLGVWDTVTGESYRFGVPTDHGLMNLHSGPVWTGDWVWFEVRQYSNEERGRARLERFVAWNPRTDDSTSQSLHKIPYWNFLDTNTAWHDDLVGLGSNEVGRATLAGDSEVVARFDPAERVLEPVHLNDAGTLVAGLRRVFQGEGADGRYPLVVLEVPGEGNADPVEVRDVPGGIARNVNGILGWRDDSHVVVWRLDKAGERILSVDVDSGEAEQLSVIEGGVPVLARDALSAPVFEAPAPPPPAPSSRPFWWGGGVVALVAGVAVLWWRRRALR